MDSYSVAVKHALSVSTLNIRHSFDFPERSLAIAREIRVAIVAIAAGLTIASVARSYWEYRTARVGKTGT